MPRGELVVSRRWPAGIVLVRHGESVGNIAAAEAGRRGAARLDLDFRDADTPLSDTGRRQAAAVATFVADDDDHRPDLVVSSPYRRAAQTAQAALDAWGTDHLVLDERLRERDLGAFDGLTSAGIREEYAAEAERRARQGKFYYKPPSGESWCDVTLRVRSLLGDLREGYEGRRVWLFTHQAVIMSFRYVLEHLTEQELLEVDRTTDLPNCSITSYRSTGTGMRLVQFADTTALERAEVPQTTEPGRAREATHGG
ncbi:histidine phosphatase family protein [Oryzihumus sp.]